MNIEKLRTLLIALLVCRRVYLNPIVADDESKAHLVLTCLRAACLPSACACRTQTGRHRQARTGRFDKSLNSLLYAKRKFTKVRVITELRKQPKFR